MDVSVRDGRHTGDASKGGCEMSQTTAGLAKNCLHPGFPGLAATETLRTARGHPGEARRGACAGPRRTAISERAVPRSPPRAAGLRPLPAPPACERLPALVPGAETQPGTRGCSDTEPPRDVAGRVEEEAAAAERPRGPRGEKPDPGSGGRQGRARLCSHVSCKPPASLCAWSVTRPAAPQLRADLPLSPR